MGISALVVALLDTIGRICATFALEVEAPPLVALIATLEIPTTYLISFIFLGETPNYLSAIGAGLIFVAIIIMGVQDLFDHSDPESKDGETSEETKDESTPLLGDAQQRRHRRRSSSRGPPARRGLSSPLVTQKVT